MSLAPSDKAALLLYWKAVHDIQEQDALPPREILKLIQKGFKMTQDAYQHIICLQCGLPWAEHPTTTPGGTDYFCISVALKAVTR